ncbi:hypothetical protein RN001_004561 [Aquatica leii]|uniref:Myb/SANT-like DNA-binding domain-containing protein n=1 Tax=Aquatica leii TaxID=1421715 RepID=A0AAN7Q019_9COLE|nr:hypothetical protein RN001_004561 [Aquatica leii]
MLRKSKIDSEMDSVDFNVKNISDYEIQRTVESALQDVMFKICELEMSVKENYCDRIGTPAICDNGENIHDEIHDKEKILIDVGSDETNFLSKRFLKDLETEERETSELPDDLLKDLEKIHFLNDSSTSENETFHSNDSTDSKVFSSEIEEEIYEMDSKKNSNQKTENDEEEVEKPDDNTGSGGNERGNEARCDEHDLCQTDQNCNNKSDLKRDDKTGDLLYVDYTSDNNSIHNPDEEMEENFEENEAVASPTSLGINKKWTDEETLLLIRTIENNYDTFNHSLKKNVYDDIAKNLNDVLKQHITAQQVDTNWKGLKLMYKKVKIHNDTSGIDINFLRGQGYDGARAMSDCIYMLADAWESLTGTNLKRAWKKLWPYNEGKDNNQEEEGDIDGAVNEITDICNKLNRFEECDIDDGMEWLAIDSNNPGYQILTDDEIANMLLNKDM